MPDASPTVVLGLPLYGDHEHVRPAIESLLVQTYEALAIVVCDDGASPRHDLSDLLGDSRVTYLRNEARLGLVGNWRQVFELGRRLYPDASYFAWASDHDIWDADWARSLADALGRSPDAVLAYPRVASIQGDLKPVPRGWSLETAGIADPVRRLLASYDRLAAGDMVYGLFRSIALERCGVFPAVIGPDRLLLAELSLLGPFVQVPELLWSRRRDVRFSLARQRESLFGAPPPRHAALPWWSQHVAVFTRDIALRDQAGLGPRRAFLASVVHASLAARRAMRRALGRAVLRARLRLGAMAGRWLAQMRGSVP